MYDEPTALHEAGHAVVADVLGHRVELVTVEPGEHAAGCSWSIPPCFSADRPSTETPLLTWPGDWQRHFAAEVSILLAGGMAERMFVPRATGRVPDPVDERAADRLAELSTPEERERAAAGVNEPGPDDAELVARQTYLAHGRDAMRAETWLRWVTEETRAVLLAHDDAVRRMAGLLMVRGTLGQAGLAAALRPEGK